MSEPLIFMMGEFEAQIPTDLLYATNHMWARATSGGYQFGLSAYAVRLLQDVYFLDWEIDSGAQLKHRAEIGSIESSKAESALFAPIEGVLAEFNQQVLADPSAINVDKYGAGWLFSIKGPGDQLLTAEQYLKHLDDSWAVAQRTIKGQLN